MAHSDPYCPKCDKRMDLGHVPDAARDQVLQSRWVFGVPEQRRFLGGIKYDSTTAIPLSAYRCPRCGFVELYARPTSDEG